MVGTGYHNLVNGAIQVEIWQAIGSGVPAMTILADGPSVEGQQTMIAIPYNSTFQSGQMTSCSRTSLFRFILYLIT